ncbi:hypothetical protein N9W89_14090, partial [Hellea sp.]|nr:hypothetical protein [Hellea sp.]
RMFLTAVDAPLQTLHIHQLQQHRSHLHVLPTARIHSPTPRAIFHFSHIAPYLSLLQSASTSNHYGGTHPLNLNIDKLEWLIMPAVNESN